MPRAASEKLYGPVKWDAFVRDTEDFAARLEPAIARGGQPQLLINGRDDLKDRWCLSLNFHRDIWSAISSRTRTAPGSRKKPTIQPTMAMGHDGDAGSRVAVQKTNADAIAEQVPITIGSRFVSRAASGSATSKPIANRTNDQPPPKRIARSNPFMWPSVAKLNSSTARTDAFHSATIKLRHYQKTDGRAAETDLISSK
jgi:hypothetical protein